MINFASFKLKEVEAMDEELSLDNILDTGEIENLFSEDEDLQETPEDTVEENPENKEKTKENKEKEATEEINADNIFDDSPESVGSGIDNDIEGKEDTTSKDSGTSPNFYSSIANALVEDGIFQNLNDEEISKIQSAEDFAEAISAQIKSQFDEIHATKVNNCKEDVEEVSVEQESNENIPSSLPVETNEFIVFFMIE